MKISNKVHRVTSILAAVMMLVGGIFGTVSQLITTINNSVSTGNSAHMLASLPNLVTNALVTILIVVALFRGKKDNAAGIMFVITALLAAVTGVFGRVVLLISNIAMGSFNFYPDGFLACMMIAVVISLLGGLITVAFRAALAMECFKPGKFSGSKIKMLLIILPIVTAVLTALAYMVQQLYLVPDLGMGEYLLMVLLPAVFGMFGSIPEVLLGVSFSIPVRERDPFEWTSSSQPTGDAN